MSVVINTNYSATIASNNLAQSNAMLQKSLNRLSSGSKIVSPADDAGGLAVSMKLSAAAVRQGAVSTNVSNAISLLQSQDGAMKVTSKVLERISELKVLYGDVTKSPSDKANYDAEFVSLQSQLRANASENFNGVALFGSNNVGSIAVTEDAQTTVTIAARDLTSTATGVGVVTNTTVTTLSGIQLSDITTAIQNIATFRATNGSEQSRLGFANELVTVNKSNLEAANSRIAANNLAASNSSLQKSLNRLSSGSKIVNPSDDAGGLAVSMKLSAAARRQGAVEANIGNAVSLLQTQDGALKVASKVLDRMSELKVLYGDITKSPSDLSNYDAEFTTLQTQLTKTAGETFNGVGLFGSGAVGSVAVTEDAQTTVSIAARNLTDSASGVGVITNSNVTTLSGVQLSDITTAIQRVATMRATNGAEQSRFGFASELVTVNKANLEAATSRITDVDVASESTQLARWNILVQAGTAMLSQANQSAQSALKLIG